MLSGFVINGDVQVKKTSYCKKAVFLVKRIFIFVKILTGLCSTNIQDRIQQFRVDCPYTGNLPNTLINFPHYIEFSFIHGR